MESGSEETGEWPSEGGLNGKFSQVGSDGNPPVIRGVRMMVRKSEWTSQDVNLGGIAEAKAFVPCGAEAFFVFKIQAAGTGPSIRRPKYPYQILEENKK